MAADRSREGRLASGFHRNCQIDDGSTATGLQANSRTSNFRIECVGDDGLRVPWSRCFIRGMSRTCVLMRIGHFPYCPLLSPRGPQAPGDFVHKPRWRKYSERLECPKSSGRFRRSACFRERICRTDGQPTSYRHTP